MRMPLRHLRPLAFCVGMSLGGAFDLRAGEYLRSFPSFAHPGSRFDSINIAGSERAPEVEPVFNCGDSGPGSLRAAVESAVSGDTIDMSQLVCSRISLTTGQIDVLVDALKLVGRADGQLIVDGSALYGLHVGILRHVGTGTLSIYDLTIAYGENVPAGGCVNSAGNVYLYDSTVFTCVAGSGGTTLMTKGGGIAADGFVALQSSVVGGGLSYGGI
ncbi:MAG TPA: hypothetical protein VH375_11615, partial [Rhodanobacteraceae bacterium]